MVKFEKSAGAVIFRRQDRQNKFLLLHYPSMSHRSKRDYWDFVKGHVEKGENEIDTVRREAVEETGLADLEFVGGFRAAMKYFFRYKGRLIFKTAVFYLAETKNETVALSDEHNDFVWLSYREARDLLSFANAKEILGKANGFLEK
jgi:8-oxo-dGTP pyrophosphatase MutT (NUDIX family)